jgi:hypothetical protein
MNDVWNSVEKLDSLVTAANWGIALTLLVAFACTVVAIKLGGRKDALTHATELGKAERIAHLDTANLTLQGQVATLQTDAATQQERAAKAEASIALAGQHAAEANAKAEGFRLDIAKANESAAQAQAQVAGATAEAAKANLELAKLRTPRTLDVEQQAAIAATVRSFSGTHFDMALSMGFESQSLLPQIEDSLKSAGWVQVAWNDTTTHAAIAFTRTDRPTAGIVQIPGVLIQVRTEEVSELWAGAVTLANALNAQGIETQVQPGLGSPTSTLHTVHVMIGEKPR